MENKQYFKSGDAYIDTEVLAWSGAFLEYPEAVQFGFGIRQLIQIVESIVLHEALLVTPWKGTATNASDLFHSMSHYYANTQLKDICKIVTRELDKKLKNDIKNVIEEQDIKILLTVSDKLREDYLDVAASTILQYHFASSLGVSFISNFSMFDSGEFNIFFGKLVNKYQDVANKILEETSVIVKQEIEEINTLLPESHFTLDVPLVFNYVLDKCSSRKDIIATAIEVRHTKEAQAFRRQLALFDEAIRIGDDKVLTIVASLSI